jgi:hypothetical protein
MPLCLKAYLNFMWYNSFLQSPGDKIITSLPNVNRQMDGNIIITFVAEKILLHNTRRQRLDDVIQGLKNPR